jgi:hypothetical protein
LYAYLRAFPAERERLVALTGPLFEFLNKDGDQLLINQWQPPLFIGNGKKKRRIAPPHVHTVEILPKNRFNVIDRDSTLGFRKDEYSNPETSGNGFAEALEWIFEAFSSSDKDSFWIKQGDTKTGGRLSKLQKKHPKLFEILNTLYQTLNDLPPGRLWYPEYASREREKASANRLG